MGPPLGRRHPYPVRDPPERIGRPGARGLGPGAGLPARFPARIPARCARGPWFSAAAGRRGPPVGLPAAGPSGRKRAPCPRARSCDPRRPRLAPHAWGVRRGGRSHGAQRPAARGRGGTEPAERPGMEAAARDRRGAGARPGAGPLVSPSRRAAAAGGRRAGHRTGHRVATARVEGIAAASHRARSLGARTSDLGPTGTRDLRGIRAHVGAGPACGWSRGASRPAASGVWGGLEYPARPWTTKGPRPARCIFPEGRPGNGGRPRARGIFSRLQPRCVRGSGTCHRGRDGLETGPWRGSTGPGAGPG